VAEPTRGAPRPRGATDRFLPRLLLGLLAAALPVLVVLAALLIQRSSASLSHAVEESLQTGAQPVASRVSTWLDMRQLDLERLARDVPRLDGPERAAELKTTDQVTGAFNVIQFIDLEGHARAASRPGERLHEGTAAWWLSATGGRTSLGRIQRDVDRLRWILAAPVRSADGTVIGVVTGDLNATQLYRTLPESRVGRTGDVVLVDGGGRKVIALSDGKPRTEAEMIAAGTLRRQVGGAVVRGLGAAPPGALRSERFEDREVAFGHAPIRALGWAALTPQDEDEAFAAVGNQRRVAVLVVLAGAIVVAIFALLFARRTTGPLTAVAAAARRVARGDLTARVQPDGAAELKELGGSFNLMVAVLDRLVAKIAHASEELSAASSELSAAADELAATTSHQTMAASETSATMEELARTSTSIADTVGAVAEQTTNTREALEQADGDMQTSSQRTLALAERVGEVSGLLELINELADQTNLLALNAAIEAARAGEAGRGFTVVADEVRRLAERSKASAADIAEIINSAQNETHATLIAMEQSSTQMRRGLSLMETVSASTDQVRLTTQQQGAATRQVVATMESVTEATRQTSATAQQIAASASGLTDLVADLRAAATWAHVDHDNGARPPGPPAAEAPAPPPPAAVRAGQ
jgi:methyl-accepting chemotaxis protein